MVKGMKMFDINAFTKPLNSKLHSAYIEELAFSMLKYVLPDYAFNFILKDNPDLQDKEQSIGIEITEAISPRFAQINGEFTKLHFGKNTENEKIKCKRLIEKNGGSLESFGLSYPVVTEKAERNIFLNAIKRKVELLPKYKEKGFTKMGLFILFDGVPIPFNLNDSMNRFAEIQMDSKDKYDFLFFGYRCGVINYNFHDMSYNVYVIDGYDFDDMSKLARKQVEEKIF